MGVSPGCLGRLQRAPGGSGAAQVHGRVKVGQPVLQAGLRPFCVSLWVNGHWVIFLFVYIYFRFLMKSLKNLLEPVTCVQNSKECK